MQEAMTVKNRYWIMIFGAIFALCLALVLMPSTDAPATRAQIKYGDKTATVDLSVDQEMVFEAKDGGYNTVTIRNGRIAVTEADCPDQYCVRQGFCNGGEQIVCLPHNLVISFPGASEIDGAVG